MQSEEQRLIDGLFSRLQQAESNTAPRDAEAERVIQAHIRQQPSAPYYMAQAMIIQEAALTKLNAQVQELQQQVQQLQQQAQTAKPQSTGFLAGLFGGGTSQPEPQRQASQGSQPIPGTQGWGSQPQQQQYAQQPQQQAPAQAAPQQPGFLGSALRTAAGVAGGVVLADMLTGMFHHSQPQEIVNIIEKRQCRISILPTAASSITVRVSTAISRHGKMRRCVMTIRIWGLEMMTSTLMISTMMMTHSSNRLMS